MWKWKELLSSMKKRDNFEQKAFEEALTMLKASHGMHRDAVAALHRPGVLVADIYERDREINRYEQEVRRKILTHLTESPRADINLGLVITAIVIDIERIGDLTKNIVELATGSPKPFDGGELDEEVSELEETLDRMFVDVVPALEKADEDLAREVLQNHKRLANRVELSLQLLRNNQALSGQAGLAVTAALYLRYMKRVSAHLKNVATSVVNPFYRIGFREKKKKKI